MSFHAPKWDSANAHYMIELATMFSPVAIQKDSQGNTVFADSDSVHNLTDQILHVLINEGERNRWFSKLPSHEQLMKRAKHTFQSLANDTDTVASVSALLLTPKQVTFVWRPMPQSDAPPLFFDDSEVDSEGGSEPEIAESDLPPVALTDDTQQTHEEYLLTRLRAARARVEAEQIRMQYFETTGRMPPDSDSEDD